MATSVQYYNAQIPGADIVEGNVSAVGTVNFGIPDPYSKNAVVKTRFSLWSNDGNIFVARTVAGALRCTFTQVGFGVTLNPSNTPALDANNRYVAEFNDKPPNDLNLSVLLHPWYAHVYLQGKAGAYGVDTVNVLVEFLKADGTVYASISSHHRIKLVNSAGQGNFPKPC